MSFLAAVSAAKVLSLQPAKPNALRVVEDPGAFVITSLVSVPLVRVTNFVSFGIAVHF